jgi:hypothetical protein
MQVYLDTSIFPTDFAFRNPALRTLFESSRRLGLEIMLPEVVIEEIVAHFREELESDWSALQSASDRLVGNLSTSGVEWSLPKLDVPAATRLYRDDLLRRLQSLTITVAPTPVTENQRTIRAELTVLFSAVPAVRIPGNTQSSRSRPKPRVARYANGLGSPKSRPRYRSTAAASTASSDGSRSRARLIAT